MRSKSKQHMEDMHRNSEDSVLMRHRREKHEGGEIPFEMKVVASFLHDPLARQCAEAIWIKKVDYDKRINNKTEFHQPRDIEVRHEKNVNEKLRRQRLAAELTTMTNLSHVEEGERVDTEREEDETSGQRKITEFLKRRRQIVHLGEDENMEFSCQDIIRDARSRRENGNSDLKCDQCNYKIKSATMLQRHIERNHEGGNNTSQ